MQMKILIAEDDENSRLLLESILISLGHTVLSAADGKQAWQLALDEKPDFVITDILMPGMDGFELCRRIRRIESLKQVPIIVYSATYVDRRDEEMALAAGANRFIVKPIEPTEMIRQIEALAAARPPAPSSAYSESELNAMHVERLQAKLRRKLIELGRERIALRNSEERLRLALAAADLGVFEWRLDSNELKLDGKVNELMTGMPGVPRTNWLDLTERIHPDDRGELAGLKSRLLSSHDSHAIVFRLIRPGGDLRWLDMNLQRMPDENFAAPPRAIGVVRDITREQLLSERLHKSVTDFDHLTRHDALTGLPNRLLFNALVDQALVAGQGRQCAVLLLDLDSFKIINDSLGHAFGDALLVLLAERIRTLLRAGDHIARMGSDEFAIVMHNVVDDEYLAKAAQQLLYALSEPTELNGERLTISASIGIARAPEDGDDRHALLRAADTALHVAKAQGKNRYSLHTADMSRRASQIHSIEQGLKRALEYSHLRVHYQPQVNLMDGELVGVEALVRWQHPSEGLISPAHFIPVAESSDLISHIGRWVLRAACAECRRWVEAYPCQMRLSVNVSARQLVNDAFIDDLRAILGETGFPAECLDLELTESTLQLVETSPRLLHEIKSLGISISIDDFGTGYSSLSVLKTLPIDRLKIDQSFVRDLTADANDVAIVEAILGMSRTLGLQVIAEGVETEAQLSLLQQLGCEAGQGYLFSRPVPPAELELWLQRTQLPA
ncbi:MAG TPA: EAL domain-containing protein [Rhodocyclaceae bacterium]|nr:EAL domain-containing protein [Rhodocyclaceae bacterium]